jgi:hypothetical protein
VAPLACPTALPSAWSAAYRAAPVAIGSGAAYPMSVSADGTLVAYLDEGPVPGSPRELVLVKPGQAPLVVYRVPNPDRIGVQSAYLVGNSLVVALGFDPRPQKGVIPGNSAGQNVRDLFVLNLATQHRTTIATAPSSPLSLLMQIAITYGHTVYWDRLAHDNATRGTVRSYNLNTGARGIVYRGPIGYPATSAAGFGWFEKHVGYRVFAGVSLPAPVAAAVPPAQRLTIGTDGAAFAWLQSPSVVGWWSPGRAEPVYRRLPRRAQLPGSFPAPVTVSGSFVFPTFTELLDMRTGGLAQLGAGLFGQYQRGTADLFGGRGTVIAMAQKPGNGTFIDGYWRDPQAVILRVDTSHLPGLHC